MGCHPDFEDVDSVFPAKLGLQTSLLPSCGPAQPGCQGIHVVLAIVNGKIWGHEMIKQWIFYDFLILHFLRDPNMDLSKQLGYWKLDMLMFSDMLMTSHGMIGMERATQLLEATPVFLQ